MSGIKGIFFDAAGVFYDRNESTAALAKRRLAELGYPIELSAECQVRTKLLHVQATEGRISHGHYWDQLLKMHAVQDDDLRAMLVKEILAQTFQVFPYPGGREAMAGLQERGFILGIVTDTIYPVEWKMKWLDQVGVAEFIKIVACSTSLGAHKPQPAMYLYAVRQAELAPETAAFVGHDAGELEGARRAGLSTVAVNYGPEAQADFYADSLLGLLEVPIFTVQRVRAQAS